MISKKINIYQLVITVVAVLFASALVVYGWSAPAGPPPGNDVPPPINVGSSSQMKLGNLGIGQNPTSSKTGIIDVNDVWIRSISKWASDVVAGSTVGMGIVEDGQWVRVPPGFTTSQCKITLIPRNYHSMTDTGGSCRDGTIINQIIATTVNTFRVQIYYVDNCYYLPLKGYYIVSCDSAGGSGGTSVLQCTPDGVTYGPWSACTLNSPVPDVCDRMGCQPMDYGTFPGTQTRTVTTCSGGVSSTTTQTQSCTVPAYYCGPPARCINSA